MPACPNGAEPLPGTTGGTVLLSLTETALGDVAGMIGGLWGELAVQPILARMSIDNLCNLNPSDPGPPTAADLEAIATYAAPFNAFQSGGNLPTWLLAQVQYHFFGISCRCIQPTETIPPRQPVATPPGNPPYPTDHDSQPQLRRIEDNTAPDNAGLTTIYNGVMELNAQIGDMSWYARPNYVGSGGFSLGSISGEGRLNLGPFAGSGNYLSGDVAGLSVHIDTFPTKYKQRGTVVPRYYGIGSIMWVTADKQSGIDRVSRRDSIHYQNQFLAMPRDAFHPRIAYRLMPGAVATISVNVRSVSGAWYGNQGWDERALLQLSADVPPATFVDPPFYPKSTRRTYSLPAASPP